MSVTPGTNQRGRVPVGDGHSPELFDAFSVRSYCGRIPGVPVAVLIAPQALMLVAVGDRNLTSLDYFPFIRRDVVEVVDKIVNLADQPYHRRSIGEKSEGIA